MSYHLLRVVAMCTCCSAAASSQTISASTGAYQRGSQELRQVGATRSPLDRRVTIDLINLPAAVALDRIAVAAGVDITISTTDHTLLTTMVSIHLVNVSLREALGRALAGTHSHLVVSSAGDLLIAEDGVPSRKPADTLETRGQFGSISGRVIDAESHVPLGDAVVGVEGTTFTVVTHSDGRYSLARLTPGNYVVTVRRLGYGSAKADAVVTPDAVTNLDVLLRVAPAILDRVVTTVTGDAQLQELGNTISTIRADSLTPNSPITSLSDIVNARAPGVQVINPGGLTGASSSLLIRGVSSLNLSTQPLLYVDGIRVANSAASVQPGGSLSVESGRLNDIVPDEIESIEIAKGPSAATLYGTDAANGVILVTTKHGSIGSPRWNIYGEGGSLTADRDLYPYNYTGWGRASGQVISTCTLLAVAAAACQQDSVTRFSPIRSSEFTPLGTGNRAEGGVQVAAGNQATRYFISGDYTSEVGYQQMPHADERMLDSILGSQSTNGNYVHPNAATKYGARLNLITVLRPDLDVSFASSFTSLESHIPNADVLQTAAGGTGYPSAQQWLFATSPISEYSTLLDENNRHFTGGVTSNWRPNSWFTGRAIVGIDLSNDSYSQLTSPALTGINSEAGDIAETQGSQSLYSVDLGGTLRFPVVTELVTNTSFGLQYHRQTTTNATASATQLTPGGTSVSAGIPTGDQVDSAGVVAGIYAEERVAYADRLFLTGAARLDGANDFGSHFQSAVYPKASASWVVSKERFLGLDFRLRAAYGESGTQPGVVLTTLQGGAAYVDGVVQPGATLGQLGNSNIQPERQREFEAGADLDALKQRVHFEFTYYNKRTTNALYAVPLGSSLGSSTVEENIGVVWNWGYEGLISASVIRSRALGLDFSFDGSINHNQVLSLGPYFQPIYGQYGEPSITAGYPIYSMFAPRYKYADLNHDGIIEPSELTVSSSETYFGPTVPPLQATVATHVTFADSRIRIGALLDYRGDFVIPDMFTGNQCFYGTAYASVNRNASLADQAACVAYSGAGGYDNRGFIQNASFIRFRELSFTFDLTGWLTRATHSRDLSVTLAARNLALWTHFSGDPESAPGTIGNVSNGVFQAGGGLPAAQYWLARVNLGL